MVIHENIYVLELEYVKFFLNCHKTLNNKDSVKEENLKAEIFLLLDESLFSYQFLSICWNFYVTICVFFPAQQ